MPPNSKNSIKNLGILTLFLMTILLLCSKQPVTYRASNFKNKQAKSMTELVKDDLDLALEKASMANRTVIITIINKAYVEPQEDEYPTMLNLFLEGFWAGENTRALVDHVLVVSMDETAHEMCEFRRLNCYNLAAHDRAVAGARNRFSRETVYMSDEFVEMMWRRTRFLLDVLKRGYNFIFTDTDVLWLRNPLTRLIKNESVDLQISVDKYDRTDTAFCKIFINTGFYFIRSNNKTTSLFQKWYDMRNNSTGKKDQDVLAGLISSDFLEKLKLNSEYLNTLYFSGFCQDSPDIRSVVTVHANCCRTIIAKVVDLKAVLRDWKKFENLKNNEYYNSRNSTTHFRWSKHTSCRSSWFKKTHKSTLG